MTSYPKIQTLWKRDKEMGKVIEGELSKPEFDNIKNWLVTEKIDGTNIRIIFKTYPPKEALEPSVEFKGRR